ncbi:YALI0D01573p [Yarrowia lipolytica CLIB122]|uniref:YALI0D01573p n=2 Tax=Yarrowia lipolytica TaxID=4952 RepID=Q6CAM0_YARLI|nr:YALI0D01573p [Yarrowia lipolytica CLIB122]KAB8282537.1 hypothetical protein BKA91DRAFT_152586 [Yarrowia lipolytica]KAE8173188.1 hypothetical protein BKA90DRAFT_151972 [Yarrowia lipolytica]KAJ8054911.1 hypothetical protein LXG23DRAFT_21034 [Yarrowia lipolytica]RMI96781.1 hypothetical protein BD777DRAFT_142371 [Yarrowia lipolytica]CAG80478.1 YALI0D01573p [Yarrowia lipolytica CLIB122]|eukprot:XP_502292.1 YALI0D01573p [Yarrowia lipolytica CLIB122]
MALVWCGVLSAVTHSHFCAFRACACNKAMNRSSLGYYSSDYSSVRGNTNASDTNDSSNKNVSTASTAISSTSSPTPNPLPPPHPSNNPNLNNPNRSFAAEQHASASHISNSSFPSAAGYPTSASYSSTQNSNTSNSNTSSNMYPYSQQPQYSSYYGNASHQYPGYQQANPSGSPQATASPQQHAPGGQPGGANTHLMYQQPMYGYSQPHVPASSQSGGSAPYGISSQLAGAVLAAAALPGGPLPITITDPTGQNPPPGVKPKVTTTSWEDEGTLCFQVEARGICVARREDNDMINGTKLLNVAGMTRGRRDGILKGEKLRHVVKAGAMHLKGVWIPYDRALEFANKEKIIDLLFPLFVRDIKSVLYHPANYARTVQPMTSVDVKREEDGVAGQQQQQQGQQQQGQVQPGQQPGQQQQQPGQQPGVQQQQQGGAQQQPPASYRSHHLDHLQSVERSTSTPPPASQSSYYYQHSSTSDGFESPGPSSFSTPGSRINTPSTAEYYQQGNPAYKAAPTSASVSNPPASSSAQSTPQAQPAQPPQANGAVNGQANGKGYSNYMPQIYQSQTASPAASEPQAKEEEKVSLPSMHHE